MNIIFCKIKTVGRALFVYVAVVLLFAGCQGTAQKESATVDRPQKKMDPPKTTVVQFMQPEYTLSVPAELVPYEQVAIHAKVSGFVKQLYVDRGSRVRKGQLLAVLEAPEMDQRSRSDRSAQQKMQSDYHYLKQAYTRLLDAAKTEGAVAALELDHAKSRMESAAAAYEASKAEAGGTAQLQGYLRITAPFDGVIVQKDVSVGALVGAGGSQPLFLMAERNRLRLKVALPERHAASVRQGMRATFTVMSQPGKEFSAVLARTSGVLNQTDRSLALEFDVANGAAELQGGDYAQVNLQLQRKSPTFWVPTKSVLTTQAGIFVLTMTNAEIKRVAVQEGIRLDSLMEVFGDLKEKDVVVVKPTEEM
ncbi:efflux RND transporter periplasmic adaptor subunit [Sphingobacterium psychroaquaticum]|uniref:RND family efflux transporter, MFP subunit n=1 Tax=Sphingobacterium psychroaquaticum TaxID=561061 RepID=A0A1X7I1L1_9SPHI|nr:efflux RND transporter periplasmic adaptor subunit [Sphingobacterium psychroaquaticum]SMG08248.1 RND family efflux transporter, MFP subunit [Sphingobacterium psychroaquaticum]